jgi:hypothetical protein
MSGFGTGVGRIPPETCVQHIALAVKHFLTVRSEDGVKKKWAEDDYPSWSDVLPVAKEVVEFPLGILSRCTHCIRKCDLLTSSSFFFAY